MDVVADLEAPAPVAAVFTWVEDLSRYPQWLGIVERAVALAADEDGLPAWSVDLRGRLGPLARSKRLRMVRTQLSESRVTFERREQDGRHHSTWVLRADVAPADDGSILTMRLHYGGALWGPVLERLLKEEITGSRSRLLDRLEGR